ncbi:MAG: SUMF1/EgtB/PvdO family nonheme iron enzyme [Myxococcales bacterium]|nr:SUMF1/EgtB/PvdO family nonheme iron enzyme [Myxococcales bacterium]MCB9582348.1 SUMF1/EgtB/PvdO family nonheme iron enzyme [Polyangiaceae bacterium]
MGLRLGWFAAVALGAACATVKPAPESPKAPPHVAAPTPPPRVETAPDAGAPAPEVAAADQQQKKPSCPEEMTLVRRAQGFFCIDRWEDSIELLKADGSATLRPGNLKVDGIEDQVRAVSVSGRKPQGYISGKQAAKACERAGKRLCQIDEWVTACRGPKHTIYPYGDVRKAKVCNDRYKKLDYHPVVRLFKAEAPPGTDPKMMWHPSWMNDPRLHEMSHSVVKTGAFEACTNEYGVYDMVGNLHEWVADPDGTFFGGYLMDTYQNGQGCEYRTIFHPYDYHDYSTGFRCCRDPNWDG